MDSTIEVQGRQLKLSNLEKVLYPATGFTKQQVIDYYVRIAPAMVPHLAGRPLTRKRYPERRGRRILLREECAPAPARLGEDCADLERRKPPHRPLHPRRRSGYAGLAGESGRDRTAPVTLAGERHYLPDDDGLRSRSGRAGKHCAMLPGWTVAAGDLRTLRTAEFPEDFRIEGAADLCSAQHSDQLRSRPRLSLMRWRSCSNTNIQTWLYRT